MYILDLYITFLLFLLEMCLNMLCTDRTSSHLFRNSSSFSITHTSQQILIPLLTKVNINTIIRKKFRSFVLFILFIYFLNTTKIHDNVFTHRDSGNMAHSAMNYAYGTT